eukprot:GHRR01033378.1.p1 GENE.GHRR01033378.1~~GHRR01033378.1.p1  ORF type:complete len:153 (+),score=32.40 GHRR01033378.1:165-623(+)
MAVKQFVMKPQKPQNERLPGAQPAPIVETSRQPGILSRVFFLFVERIIRDGHRTILQTEHLYKPDLVHTDKVYGVFEEAWQKQLAATKPDIRRAVVANSIGGLIFTGLLYCVSLASQLVGPMMLQRIVGGLQCWARTGGQKGGICPAERDLY